MRILVLALVLAGGCAGNPNDSGSGNDTGDVGDSGNSGDSGDSGGDTWHPNIPVEKRGIWNPNDTPENQCKTMRGSDGNQVYIVGEGRAESATEVTFTEKFYWFMRGTGWDGDCVDTFEITAQVSDLLFEDLGCTTCDEQFEFERRITDDQCHFKYNGTFGWSQRTEPADGVYPGFILIEDANPDGVPYPNAGVYMNTYKSDRRTLNGVGREYWAKGHAIPDNPSKVGPPSDYDWEGDHCW